MAKAWAKIPIFFKTKFFQTCSKLAQNQFVEPQHTPKLQQTTIFEKITFQPELTVYGVLL